MAQFTSADLEQLAARGISPETVEAQLERFRTGFPYLRIDSPSAMGCGITPVDEATADACVARWERFLADGGDVLKFVPASGAASRMFKALFAFVNGDEEIPADGSPVAQLVENIHDFAFYGEVAAKTARLYDATREDAAFREGRGELYRGIAQCDDERDQINRALQALQDAAAAEEAARQSFTCAVCGAQVRGGDLFCSGCGTPAEQARAVQPSCATADAGLRCATCGAPLKADYAFCMECGTPVQLAPEADGSAADEPDGTWADEPAIAAPQCPMCGAAAEEGQAFCMQCGASLARSE